MSLTKPQQVESKKTAFINARLIDPASNIDCNGSLLVAADGTIEDIDTNNPNPDLAEDIEVVDCKEHILCPGLLDIQVHFRTPGQEHKEDIETGTKSAAVGGVTTAVCMANTSPTIDNAEILANLYSTIKDHAYVNVHSYASITKGLAGQDLTDMAALKDAGAIGFSDDGLPVMNSLTMRRAMEQAKELDILIAQHAEDSNLSNGGCINEGKVSKQLNVVGIPNASEAIIVERDLLLLELTKAKYHVLHISTHQAVDAVRRAKDKGLPVTAEVAPHHFILTDEAVLEFDSLAKMNPPLRVEQDKQALIDGLKDGTIDAIATDHAPHDPDSKNVHISQAAFGIVGLETMLPLSLELYHRDVLSLSEVIGKMTYQAADIVGLPVGRLSKGLAADLTLIDINHEWQVDPTGFCSKSINSPFEQYDVKGRAVRTIVAGKTVFDIS